MTNLETIVRPFQTRDVTPPRRIESSESDGSENLRLEIGKNASAGGKMLITTYSASISRYMTKQEKEVDGERETHIKTITSDEGVEIDIEVIDKLSLKRGKAQDFQKTRLEFKNQDEGGG